MGLIPFCFWSALLFLLPTLILLSLATQRRLGWALGLANLVLLLLACWLFPQISRESLALSKLMFSFYCYLVLSFSVAIGAILKAIEFKSLRFIPLVFISLCAVNLSAFLYSSY